MPGEILEGLWVKANKRFQTLITSSFRRRRQWKIHWTDCQSADFMKVMGILEFVFKDLDSRSSLDIRVLCPHNSVASSLMTMKVIFWNLGHLGSNFLHWLIELHPSHNGKAKTFFNPLPTGLCAAQTVLTIESKFKLLLTST